MEIDLNTKEELEKFKTDPTEMGMKTIEKSKGKQYVVNEEIHQEFKNIFNTLTEGKPHKVKEIEVMQGRVILCKKYNHSVAYFHFSELCEEAVGAADFIAVAQNFSTILLEGIPIFDISVNRSAMRRFINLVRNYFIL